MRRGLTNPSVITANDGIVEVLELTEGEINLASLSVVEVSLMTNR
jgi:hypothetical protein